MVLPACWPGAQGEGRGRLGCVAHFARRPRGLVRPSSRPPREVRLPLSHIPSDGFKTGRACGLVGRGRRSTADSLRKSHLARVPGRVAALPPRNGCCGLRQTCFPCSGLPQAPTPIARTHCSAPADWASLRRPASAGGSCRRSHRTPPTSSRGCRGCSAPSPSTHNLASHASTCPWSAGLKRSSRHIHPRWLLRYAVPSHSAMKHARAQSRHLRVPLACRAM